MSRARVEGTPRLMRHAPATPIGSMNKNRQRRTSDIAARNTIPTDPSTANAVGAGDSEPSPALRHALNDSLDSVHGRGGNTERPTNAGRRAAISWRERNSGTMPGTLQASGPNVGAPAGRLGDGASGRS